MTKSFTYIVDIDGTICTNTGGSYELAAPYQHAINKMNILYEQGHIIVYFTARGATTGIDWTDFTKEQFNAWGVKYHQLICGSKPYGDFYIDDKAVNASTYFADEISSCASLTISNKINSFISLLRQILLDSDISSSLTFLLASCSESIRNDKKLIFCGNGGSFSDSLHLAAEFTGRYQKDRCSLPAIVLGSNPSSLTAIANDYDYTQVFTREFSSLAKSGDSLICLSTSGNSPNIVNLLNSFDFKNLNINTHLLTSLRQNSKLPSNTNVLRIPSLDTAFIQQIHMLIGHYICESLDHDVE